MYSAVSLYCVKISRLPLFSVSSGNRRQEPLEFRIVLRCNRLNLFEKVFQHLDIMGDMRL